MQVYETLPEDRYLQLVLQTHKQEMQTFSRRNQILPQMSGMFLVGNSWEWLSAKEKKKFSFIVHSEHCGHLNKTDQESNIYTLLQEM